MKRWSTVQAFIANGRAPASETVTSFEGFASKGDGGASFWLRTGSTGTSSQSPINRGDNLLNDASGAEWKPTKGTTFYFDGTNQWFPSPFGDSGVGLYQFNGSGWDYYEEAGGAVSIAITSDLISSSFDYDVGAALTFTGYSSPGDGGAAQWKKTALTGTPSQSPSQRGDGTLTDATGAVWEIVTSGEVSIRCFGATGSGDDTGAFQAAASSVDKLIVESVEYTISSVSLKKSIEVQCIGNPTFKRKDNTDVTQKSYWSTGAAMFEVDAEGLSVAFTGGFTYDGNNQNQPSIEPTGFFIKTYPQASPSGLDTKLHLQGGEFFNGTSGYVLIRGDDVNKRFETIAILDNCTFHETIYGKGKGDPSTPNALGYSPTMVFVLDYVKLYTNNFTADWEKPTGLGQYAACALNGTFFGVDYNQSGESSVYMHGTTRITNLGRSAKKYDDDNDWVTNNGIGAIDMYGNADTLLVESVIATDCQNVPVRAKGSIKNYTVLSAILTNCHRGLQVGPSSTGDPETVAYIGSATSYGGTIPQMEFVGNSPSAKLKSVHLGKYDSYESKTNPESLVNEPNIKVRNCAKVTGGSLFSSSNPLRGFSALDCDRVEFDSIILSSSGAEGVFISNVELTHLSFVDIRLSGGAAVSIAGTAGKISIMGGSLDGAAGYGVFNNSPATLNIDGVAISNLSGVDRALYFSGTASGSVNRCSTDSATPIFAVAGSVYNEAQNSWNAVEFYGSVAPTTGTYKVGDRVLNTNPSASGNVGWICVTAGSPGTFKEFGTIEA